MPSFSKCMLNTLFNPPPPPPYLKKIKNKGVWEGILVSLFITYSQVRLAYIKNWVAPKIKATRGVGKCSIGTLRKSTKNSKDTSTISTTKKYIFL